MVGEQVQHYRILRQLGVGGMGVVYEAEDSRLGRHVAIKLLPESLAVAPDVIERFEREARIASSLNHPNICTIYDIGSDPARGNRRFIVMELLEGESLRERIHGQPLPIELVVDTGCQIADALDAAQAKGVIHRDIKPANIFITKRGQAKLLDFGIAKLGSEGHAVVPSDETRRASDVLTVPGSAIGSVNYMSPEQARGEELDGRTDLFSLGVVLYEMVTGRQAFAGQTTAVVFDGILNRQPPEPALTNPAIPDDLTRVIHRSLEKDRRMRFQTAADMLSELSRIRRDTTGRTLATSPTAVVPPIGSTAVAAPAAPTRRWIRFGVPAVVIAGVAGYYVWNANRTPAFTERDTVVVADFANTTGDGVFDDALRQALSVQLQQTPFITLLPDARVQRTLKLMQRQPDDPVTPAVARELCQRVGAKATVEGSIAPMGSSYVITLGVHNCQTGAALAEQQVQARSKEEVIERVGQATTEIRRRLGESLASIQKYDVPVTEATTASLDALKAYGLANRTRFTRGDEASIPFFRKAIEFDPNFALAYAKLGVVLNNVGQVDEAITCAQRAYEMKDRVSEYERLYIEWNYNNRVLNDQKKTLESLELMTASYPRDFAAQNNLGVYYIGRGKYEDAAQHYRAAIDIAPDEPLPMANLAYALYYLDKPKEANTWADKSLAIRQSGSLAVMRWQVALRLNDPDAVKYEAVAKTMATPEDVLASQAQYALWRGDLEKYRQLMAQVGTQLRAAHNDEAAEAYEAAGRIANALFEGGAAIDALKASLPALKGRSAQVQTALALAALGQVAAAKPVTDKLGAIGRDSPDIWIPLAIVKAYQQAADGRPRDAVAQLDTLSVNQPQWAYVPFHSGRICAAAGDLQCAEDHYRAVLRATNLLGFDPVLTAARWQLGEVLAKKGDTAGAKEQFDALLAQWDQAGKGFMLLDRVREERKKIE